MNARPYRTRLSQRQLAGLAMLCLLAGLQAWRSCSDTPPAAAPLDEGLFHVRRVVDGDTLLLDEGKRVRLIGVDTPETVKEDTPVEPWGPEATSFTRAFVDSVGGQVRMTFDRERFDRFGRYLAYVWADDRLLNEELLRAGLGRWERNFDYSAAMKTRFRKAQQEAQKAHRGMWSATPARQLEHAR